MFFLFRWVAIKRAWRKTRSTERTAKPTSSSTSNTHRLREFSFSFSLTRLLRYTSQVIVTPTGEVSQGTIPVQIIFCLKEQNKKKLNSHRWFFNAFGPLINPNGESDHMVRVGDVLIDICLNVHEVCILLDVGTKPTGDSIYHLWKCE